MLRCGAVTQLVSTVHRPLCVAMLGAQTDSPAGHRRVRVCMGAVQPIHGLHAKSWVLSTEGQGHRHDIASRSGVQKCSRASKCTLRMVHRVRLTILHTCASQLLLWRLLTSLRCQETGGQAGLSTTLICLYLVCSSV